MAVTVDDIREIALALPRTTEALVSDRVKFRVGRLVYLALSRDETLMGFAFPKEERRALVGIQHHLGRVFGRGRDVAGEHRDRIRGDAVQDRARPASRARCPPATTAG